MRTRSPGSRPIAAHGVLLALLVGLAVTVDPAATASFAQGLSSGESVSRDPASPSGTLPSAGSSAASNPGSQPASPAAETSAVPPATATSENAPSELPYQFSGQVLGPDSKPIPKARIAMVSAPAETEWTSIGGASMSRLMRGSLPKPPAADEKKVFYTATSDREGRFVVKLPGSGPYHIRIEADDLAPLVTEKVRAAGPGQKAPAPTSFSLQSGFPLTGKVFDLGKKSPVAGAKLYARAPVDRAFIDPEDPERFVPTAVVRSDGAFLFKHLGPNFYDLEVVAPGHALGLAPKVPLDASRQEPVILYLEPGLSVSGRVVDHGGKGLAGASVSARRDLPLRFSLASFRMFDSLRARTDSQGRFKLVGLPQASQLNLTAELPDGSRGRFTLPDPAGRTHLPDVEIVLERPSRITGRLLDAGGQPVGRASITVSCQADKAGARAPDFHRDADAVKIGAKGEFSIDKVPSGECGITLEPDGFKKHEIEKARLEPGGILDLGPITLERGHTIRGKVTIAEGKPIPKAEITAFAFQPGKFSRTDTRTDSEGKYLLGGLDDQRYSVSTHLEGFGDEQKTEIAADSEGIDFVLGKAGGISGRVVTGPNALPVTSFTARTLPKRGSRDMGFAAMLSDEARPFSDPGGRFSLTGLSAGDYSLEIDSPGFAKTLREVAVKPGEVTELGEVALNPGATLLGRVVDRDGSPVAGARVKPRAGGLFSLNLLTEDKASLTGLDGKFVLKGLPSGSQTIVAEHPDYAKTEGTARAEAGEEPEELVLTMGKGGRIVGVVRDSAGNPTPGTIVMATILSDPLGRVPVQTDAEGKYAIENLAPGGYTVMKLPSSPGGRVTITMNMESKQTEVKEGETVTVNFGDEKKIRVYGAVRRSSGPLPRARLIWVPSRFGGGMPGNIATASSDDAGQYEVQLPKAGKYSVRISGADEPFTAGTGLEVDVPEGADFKKDIVLPEGSIAGVILSASDNQPVEGAQVRVLSAADEARRDVAGSASSDSAGSYHIDNLSPGTYRIVASKEGFASETVEKVAVGSSGAGSADFLLRPGRKILARVLDSDARPLAQTVVFLLDSEGKPLDSRVMTGVDGTATVGGVKEGSYGLLAFARDLAPTAARDIVVTPEADGAAELRLPAGGSLIVKVVDAQNGPVTGASVTLVDPSGVDLGPLMPTLRLFTGLPTVTASDGTIAFPHLVQGTYRVSAASGTGGKAEGSVELLDGKRASLTLTIK